MTDLQTVIAWRTAPDKAVRLAQSQPLSAIKEALEKQSFNALGELGEYLQLIPGSTFGIPSSPAPLTSMLVGGLTGAGIGYGAGRLAESYMPESWDQKRARKTFSLIGGALGAAPGLLWGLSNLQTDRPFSNSDLGSTTAGPIEWGPYDRMPGYPDPKIAAAARDTIEKMAHYREGDIFYSPPIDVNEFNSMVWQDPRVAGHLSLPQRAAACGLITGAANLPGKSNPRLVTPLDMGRMAIGMGSGFMSGALVGRTLGALLGMPQSAQDRLKETGIIAGAIANALPLIYG